jgi:hypothetical protein
MNGGLIFRMVGYDTYPSRKNLRQHLKIRQARHRDDEEEPLRCVQESKSDFVQGVVGTK